MGLDIAKYELILSTGVEELKLKLEKEKLDKEGTCASDTEKEDRFSIINKHDQLNLTDEEKLQDFTAALKRIENGTYGICIECGSRIDEARLDILPQAKRCCSCQSKKKSTVAHRVMLFSKSRR